MANGLREDWQHIGDKGSGKECGDERNLFHRKDSI
jgi:hypothetical protein